MQLGERQQQPRLEEEKEKDGLEEEERGQAGEANHLRTRGEELFGG